MMTQICLNISLACIIYFYYHGIWPVCIEEQLSFLKGIMDIFDWQVVSMEDNEFLQWLIPFDV